MNEELRCPHCKNDDKKMIEETKVYTDYIIYTCDVCTKTWPVRRNHGKNVASPNQRSDTVVD
jgi:transposase-like protein